MPGEPQPVENPTAAPVRGWAEIRALAEAALALPPEERVGYLDGACGADPGLRTEVQAQVHACERAAAAAFLTEPAAARVASLFADLPEARERPAAGADVGQALEAALRAALARRYAVEAELVRGGTATVYVARDTRHGRRVALKVLDPALGAAMSSERFLREIHVTAGLTHPHILPLHDSGEAAGRPYYVMPYVDGETLKERLAREGALPVAEAVRLLRELADALAYAHGRGVVHRDIKPGNILLHGGHALVADFGIARAVHRAREAEEPTPDESARPTDGAATDTLTAVGTSPGTPAYMAPEQASGGAIDERADLYALGVVAYEMLAGEHPFGARTAQAIVEAHRTRTAPALVERRPDVPPALGALVARLLAKSPADRPASAAAVLHALEGIAARPAWPRPVGRLRAVTGAALLCALGLGGYLVWGRARSAGDPHSGTPPASAGASALRAVAVLPFVNASGDPQDEYFSDGLTDELASALAHVPGLRIAGRTSSYLYKGKSIAAQEVGRTLGVDALVAGTVRRTQNRLRITAQLVSTADGTVRWDSVYEAPAGNVFAVQDGLTRAIAAALAPALRGRPGASEDRAADIERGTADQEAYELFLKGRYNFLMRNPTRLLRSITYFQQAVARDPTFARAYAGLSLAYSVLPTYFPGADSAAALARASAQRAVALDSSLADAQFALAAVLENDLRFREAMVHYRQGLARDPASVTGHFWLGVVLLNLGRSDDGLVELRLATQLDPLAHSAAAAVAMALLAEHRFAEAATAARHSLAIDSTFWGAAWALGTALAFDGRPDSAVSTLTRALRLHPNHPHLLAALALADAAGGRWADAARVRQQLHRPGGDESGGVAAAIADMVFGDREPALRLLATDGGRRQWYLSSAWFGCSPILDPLWSEPRFREAMRRMAAEPCPERPWPIRAHSTSR